MEVSVAAADVDVAVAIHRWIRIISLTAHLVLPQEHAVLAAIVGSGQSEQDTRAAGEVNYFAVAAITRRREDVFVSVVIP